MIVSSPPPHGDPPFEGLSVESAYTRGVADALGAAITVLQQLRSRLSKHGSVSLDLGLLASVARAEPNGVDRLRTGPGFEAGDPDASSATWIAAFALALAKDHRDCCHDVEELLQLSGRDPVLLELASSRLQTEAVDTATRGQALRILRKARQALADGKEEL